MKFTPRSDAELASEGLLQPGVYDVEIVEAEEATSRAGNEMIRARVRVFTPSGGSRIVTDFLMSSMGRKLRSAADMAGLTAQYQAGELLAEDFVGRTGKAKVGIEKDKSGQYPDRNRIEDYLPAQDAARAPAAPKKFGAPPPASDGRRLEPINDDIPF